MTGAMSNHSPGRTKINTNTTVNERNRILRIERKPGPLFNSWRNMHKYLMEARKKFGGRYRFYVFATNRYDAMARSAELLSHRNDLEAKNGSLRVVRRIGV